MFISRYLGWLAAPVILLAGFILLLLSYRLPGFAAWYANSIYPVFPRTAGWFWGLFPFSVFEVLLLLSALCLLAGVVSLFRRTGRAWLKNRAKALLCIPAAVFLIFVLTAGMNYNRESYADHIGITVQPSSTEELIQLYLLLVERAGLLAGQVETDANGHFVLDRTGMYDYARQSMRDLNSLYGGLNTCFPRAKAPITSRLLLSNFKIAGFFSPWTLEAHYNGDIPGQSIPFVINHELAHVAGHMREDEANFIAYLASRNAGHVDFQYSAVYVALSYVLNALRGNISAERYNELFALLPDQIVRDFAYARAYWRQFEGPAADMATRANDTYLRLNRQEDGVQSYGRMVDLLLAYYRFR
jgi:hypothetical protein